MRAQELPCDSVQISGSYIFQAQALTSKARQSKYSSSSSPPLWCDLFGWLCGTAGTASSTRERHGPRSHRGRHGSPREGRPLLLSLVAHSHFFAQIRKYKYIIERMGGEYKDLFRIPAFSHMFVEAAKYSLLHISKVKYNIITTAKFDDILSESLPSVNIFDSPSS